VFDTPRTPDPHTTVHRPPPPFTLPGCVALALAAVFVFWWVL
jgi:hypothetical protein